MNESPSAGNTFILGLRFDSAKRGRIRGMRWKIGEKFLPGPWKEGRLMEIREDSLQTGHDHNWKENLLIYEIVGDKLNVILNVIFLTFSKHCF
jgi:hypothetical protein